MQALLNSLARSSSMVRHAMAAFAVVRASPSDTTGDYQAYYEKAASRLSQRFQEADGTRIEGGEELRYSLAAIFFLTYADVIPSYMPSGLTYTDSSIAPDRSPRSGLLESGLGTPCDTGDWDEHLGLYRSEAPSPRGVISC